MRGVWPLAGAAVCVPVPGKTRQVRGINSGRNITMKGPDKGGMERLGSSRAPSSFIAAIRSDQVFAGDKEVAIEHGGDIYWLRRTRNNKLILTK